MKKKRGDTGEPDLEHLLAMLDGIDDVMYVADPERFELLYVNRAARDIWGEDILGKKCHLMLQGRDAPCSFCTNDKIRPANFNWRNSGLKWIPRSSAPI